MFPISWPPCSLSASVGKNACVNERKKLVDEYVNCIACSRRPSIVPVKVVCCARAAGSAIEFISAASSPSPPPVPPGVGVGVPVGVGVGVGPGVGIGPLNREIAGRPPRDETANGLPLVIAAAPSSASDSIGDVDGPMSA